MHVESKPFLHLTANGWEWSKGAAFACSIASNPPQNWSNLGSIAGQRTSMSSEYKNILLNIMPFLCFLGKEVSAPYSRNFVTNMPFIMAKKVATKYISTLRKERREVHNQLVIILCSHLVSFNKAHQCCGNLNIYKNPIGIKLTLTWHLQAVGIFRKQTLTML